MCWPSSGKLSGKVFERFLLQLSVIHSSLAGQKSYVTVLNINDDVESVNLDTVFTELSSQLQYVVVNDKSSRRKK